jgi:hypothetical protein
MTMFQAPLTAECVRKYRLGKIRCRDDHMALRPRSPTSETHFPADQT